jgi:hypothetical protein
MAKLTGTNPDQVPTNADLGDMAYKDGENLQAGPLTIKDGKVGVGTTNPNAPVEIAHSGVNIDALRLGDPTTVSNNTGIYLRTTGLASIGWGSSGSLRFLGEGNNTERMRITSTGEVDISSGLLELNGNDIGGTQVTIADDAVASITPPRKGGFMFITAGLSGGEFPQQSRSGAIFFDVGSSLEIQERITASALDVSTSDVTGTTGTDGNVTVAVQSGVIKIENRGGTTHVFDITFL